MYPLFGCQPDQCTWFWAFQHLTGDCHGSWHPKNGCQLPTNDMICHIHLSPVFRGGFTTKKLLSFFLFEPHFFEVGLLAMTIYGRALPRNDNRLGSGS
jgi:hypothetical protein